MRRSNASWNSTSGPGIASALRGPPATSPSPTAPRAITSKPQRPKTRTPGRHPPRIRTRRLTCPDEDFVKSNAIVGLSAARGEREKVRRVVRVFDDNAWNRTVYLIGKNQCTPFVGAGASAEHLPVAGRLAEALAEEYGYPFDDNHDLARVTQFAAVREGSRQYVKQRLTDDMFADVPLPNFRETDEPHAMLADLNLPIYLTTNYDDFMFEALQARGRAPQRAICPWYTKERAEVEQANALFREAAGFNPDSSRPIVYHLHGHRGTPESLVLTEDDYIDFLVRVSGDPELLPPTIQKSLTSKMLLFVGYSLSDWTFRVIFRGLLSARPPLSGHSHVSVQLPPPPDSPTDERPLRIQEYLDRYFDKQDISICWKTARDFSAELRRRWAAAR